jgi:hypothetical protein
VLKSSERDDKPEIGLGVISMNTLSFAAAWIGKTPGFHLKAVGAATAFSHQQRLFSFGQASPT